MGQSAGEIVKFQHHCAGGVVGAAPVVQIRKGAEIRVGVGVLQHGGQGLLPQAAQGGIVGSLEVRRDIQGGKVLLHKMQAEGIHRADGRPLQAQLLAAQAGVVGAAAHFGQKAGGDVRPQLGCRRVGEGHNKKAVRLHRVHGVGDEPHGTLHQYAGLAGTGRRADQKTAAPGPDGRGLGRSETNGLFGHGNTCKSVEGKVRIRVRRDRPSFRGCARFRRRHGGRPSGNHSKGKGFCPRARRARRQCARRRGRRPCG